MKNETLYNKTVDILVQAYFNDTLTANDCVACACGNIIAANNGYEICSVGEESYWRKNDDTYIYPLWVDVVATPTKSGFLKMEADKQMIKLHKYEGSAKEEILSSGYCLKDFAKIENAFEVGYWGGRFVKDRMFNALMNVIDALDEIHENTNEEKAIASKQKFNKPKTELCLTK